MSKYVVIGGFLGAGKTTGMMAFADEILSRKKKPAILVNDLGIKNLVDGKYTEYKGYLSREITGDCICYQTENLVDALREFRDLEEADIIFSDIPGCGIGALDHVYHKLNRDYPGEFELCPFVAVADPERLRVIMPEKADIHLPKEMDYLFDAQLKEAEVILLNKTDLLTEEQIGEYLHFLKTRYPQAAVFAMSARRRTGIKEIVDYLLEHHSTLPETDIGYGGPEFVAAEETMSWYNRQFFVKCDLAKVDPAEAGRAKDDPFSGKQFITRLMDGIRQGLAVAGRNVPHLKAMAETENGDILKVSLTGIDEPLQWDQDFPGECRSLKVILNARAVCESDRLDTIMDFALREAVKQFGLTLKVYFTECFGMMDEGRE